MVFKNVTEGIILEDDCHPHPEFFKFTEILINYYRNNNKVWTISGNTFKMENGEEMGLITLVAILIVGVGLLGEIDEHYDQEATCWENLKNLI